MSGARQGGVRAVLFDLDGTLADTERLQWQAYSRVLARFGVAVDLDTYRRRFVAVAGGAEWACEAFRLPIDAATLRAEKAVAYRRLLEGGVVAMPGARAALTRLRPHWRLGVATNSVRDEAWIVLERIGLHDLLDTVVAREDYAAAKPAPDAWLAAAQRLGVAPAECVVVEDTPRGLAAGLAAGMRVIAVPSDLTADQDFTGAVAVLPSLDALTPALLERLAPPSGRAQGR